MKKGIIWIGIFLLFSIESTIISLPLTLIALILFYVFSKDISVFFLAFFLGFFYDALHFYFLGTTSIFFLSMLLLMFFYERKFEVTTLPFFLFFSFMAVSTFLIFFSTQTFLIEVFLTTLIGILLYLVLIYFGRLTIARDKLQ